MGISKGVISEYPKSTKKLIREAYEGFDKLDRDTQITIVINLAKRIK